MFQLLPPVVKFQIAVICYEDYLLFLQPVVLIFHFSMGCVYSGTSLNGLPLKRKLALYAEQNASPYMPIHLELSIAKNSEFHIANEIRYFTEF